ncbi:MAG: 16S rRNA (cytosine(1402)-N(4))-methyltransferase RsmH [Planctomycetaceae bacterium]|nr:16S rRNA (cytosine(1402)-N(4))-methyltransferase RsmH [Planctomycetaceae bacterium]
MSETVHVPVLLREVLELLNLQEGTPQKGKIVVDGTLGGGGHTEALCRAGARVIALDRDIAAIDRTERRLRGLFSGEPFPVRFVHADYRFFAEALDMLEIEKIDGFLLDLGLSSDQLADGGRGFSFDSDGELDMRFDPSEGLSAREMLEKLPEAEIADNIYQFGEERHSRRIARKIVEAREKGQPIRTARQLAELVRQCVPKSRKQNKLKKAIDPATRTFQALRIAVNDELGSLQSALDQLPSRMNPGGVAAVISFHSLEDRIVKTAFRDDRYWNMITPKPITATAEEIADNPRARSAKLRGVGRKE